MINDYQAKYYAFELSKRCSSDSTEKFGATLLDAKVDLNPHQVEAALFAFKSPLSKGAILADEVGLGKTIKTEFQSKLEDKNTFLNSFIISNTSFKDMRYRRSHEETIDHYHDVNVYFQDEDKHTYIEKVLEKGLIE